VERERALSAEEANLKVATEAKNSANSAQSAIGTLENLNTTEKNNLVEAINEVYQAVETGGTGSAVTMTKSDDGLTYTLSQGTTTIGTINIPKDMVVTSGSVVINPEGQATGTYIELLLANTVDPLYINVGTLVDLYTAAEDATQIQVTVDNTTRKIGATIIANSINTVHLTDNVITTSKLADTNVTLAKLSTELQASINKANSAIQKVTTGSSNGTIAVDDVDIAIKGLRSAAYAETSAFDTNGSAAAAEASANAYTDAVVAAAIDALTNEDID
jgi:hypothetical protein